MASGVPVASGSASVQAVNGPVSLAGIAMRETAGTPGAASFVLRDGTTNTDPIRYVVKLVASESRSVPLHALTFNTGVFVHREAGTTELVLYVL